MNRENDQTEHREMMLHDIYGALKCFASHSLPIPQWRASALRQHC